MLCHPSHRLEAISNHTERIEVKSERCSHYFNVNSVNY